MDVVVYRCMSIVRQIMLSCGFNDGNYFSRQFRKTTGISPREYRKQATALGNFNRA